MNNVSEIRPGPGGESSNGGWLAYVGEKCRGRLLTAKRFHSTTFDSMRIVSASLTYGKDKSRIPINIPAERAAGLGIFIGILLEHIHTADMITFVSVVKAK